MNLFEGLRLIRINPGFYQTEAKLGMLAFIVTIGVVKAFQHSAMVFSITKSILQDSPIPVGYGLYRIILWILIYLVLKWFVDLCRHGSEYHFGAEDWETKWLSSGNCRVTKNPTSLLVDKSESGCLMKYSIWKNFSLEFTMLLKPVQAYHDRTEEVEEHGNIFKKIVRHPVDPSMGILFRAMNLDSYYMIEMHINENGDLMIKPHARLDGIWDPVDDMNMGRVWDPKLPINVKLVVEGRTATLNVGNTCMYEWILSTHIGGYKYDKDPTNNPPRDARTAPQIPFTHEYGMFGFRASWYQGATITDLSIKTLSWWDMFLLGTRRLF